MLTASQPLTEGSVTVAMTYVQGDKANSGGGMASLSVIGAKVAEGPIKQVVAARYSATETLDVGRDLGSVVSDRYHAKAPFPFTRTIEQVTVVPGDPTP